MSFLRNVGRVLLGALYVAVPIFGWIALARSFKRVNPGEISIVNNIDGTFDLLEEGLYYRPFFGDRFGGNFKKSDDYIDLGPVQQIRIKQGELGVMNERGIYKELGPGIHLIDNSKNQTFNPRTDVQKINQLDYTLGSNRYITILNGELGESYINGVFTLLEPGKYTLPPHQVFKKRVQVNSEIVDLTALKIVTVKEGQAAIINGPDGNIIKGPGKHYIKQDEGYYFERLITTSPQVLPLDEVIVLCTDKIEMKAEAVLSYEIINPLSTVGSGIERVLNGLKVVSDAALRSILRRCSSSDISPALHEDENHASHARERKLKEIHDEFVKDLDNQAKGWGIKINNLQFTHILPADEEYHKTIRSIGTQQSTAEANKALAEAAAAVANIKAQAEQSRVTAAQIEQKEMVVRTETDVKKMQMMADAEYNQTLRKAEANADSIKKIASAECERLTKLGQVADNFKTEAARMLAFVDKQEKVFANIKNPIFIQPQLGDTSIWSKEDNRATFFTNSKKVGSSNVVDYLALESARKLQEVPGLK